MFGQAIFNIMGKYGWASPNTMRKMLIPTLLWFNIMIEWEQKEQKKAEKKAAGKAKSGRRR